MFDISISFLLGPVVVTLIDFLVVEVNLVVLVVVQTRQQIRGLTVLHLIVIADLDFLDASPQGLALFPRFSVHAVEFFHVQNSGRNGNLIHVQFGDDLETILNLARLVR